MATLLKAATGTDLSLAAAWSPAQIPTSADTCVFDSTGNSGAFTMSLSRSIGSISFRNPAAGCTITITAGQTLTLGASGIDMSTATQSLTFGATGTIALSASATLDVSATTTCTINCPVTGTGFSFTKSGTGIAVLTGSNTGMTGAFFIAGGTVRVGNAGALGGATASLNLLGGTLTSNSTSLISLTNAGASTISGSFTFGAAATFTGQLTFANAFLVSPGVTITTLSTALFNGVISGTDITKAGAGTLSLQNAANTYTGPTNITAGSLSISTLANGGSPSSIGQSSTTATNLVFGASTSLTLSGSVSGTTDRNFTMNGGAFITASGTTPVLWSGSPTLTASATLSLSGTSGAGVINTFSGTLANTGAFVLSLSRPGTSATWKISGANTFTGNFTHQATGSTLIGHNDALGGPTATMSNTGGASAGPLCSDGATARVITNSGAGTIIGSLTLGDATNNGALTFSNAFSFNTLVRTLTIASPVTMSGVLSNGGMVKAGSSSLTLSGAGTNTYATASTLSAGKIIIGKSSALGTAAWTINAGTSLDATSNFLITNALTIAGSFTFDGTTSLTQSTGAITLSTATITVTANTLTLNGAITGAAASLTKDGAGQITLAGANTGWGSTSGDINVNAGVLWGVTNTSALGANMAGRNIIVSSGATLNLGTSVSLGSIPLSIAGAGTGVGSNDAALLLGASPTFSSITLTAPATIRASANNTLTGSIVLNGNAPTFLATTGFTLTLPSAITDTGTATVTIGIAANTYTGTVSLTNASGVTPTTFSGQVRVLSGTLSASTLADAGTNSSIGTGSAASTIQLGSGTNSATFTYNSSTTPVSTDRAIELMGTTGAVRVNGGTSSGVLTLPSNLIVTGVGAKTFTLGNNGVFFGVIADGGVNVISLSSASGSVWTLANSNTYTGGTSITGTLTIDSPARISTGTITGAGAGIGRLTYTGTSGTVSNALTLLGAFRITLPTASSDVTFSGLIASNGSLDLGDSGFTTGQTSVLRLTNTGNTWGGGLTINTGAVYVTDAGQLGTGTKTINVSLNSYGSSGLVLDATSGAISLPATFSFTTSNSGTRAGTYNGIIAKGGAVTINGTVTMGPGGGPSVFTADAGATFTLTGTLTASYATRFAYFEGDGTGTVSGVINNTNTPAVLVGGGSGTWTLSNTNLYAGGTTVNSSATAFVTNTQGLGLGAVTIGSATAKVQSGTTVSSQNGKLTVTGTLTNSAGGTIRIGG